MPKKREPPDVSLLSAPRKLLGLRTVSTVDANVATSVTVVTMSEKK